MCSQSAVVMPFYLPHEMLIIRLKQVPFRGIYFMLNLFRIKFVLNSFNISYYDRCKSISVWMCFF